MMDAAVRAQERVCDAGEFVVECFTADGETYPHVGSQAVGERVVRCRDCVHRASDPLGEYCTLFDFEDVNSKKMLNGFCAWGERRDA